jgi:hypothetical protein
MTTPAITIQGQQSRLTFATALGKAQSVVTFPLAAALMESGAGEAIALENREFADADEVIQDIVSCDGRNLADRVIQQWSGTWPMEFFATSRWLGWAAALAFGDASEPGVVAASSAVFTETITATGGTKYYYVEGKKTAEVAFDAAAAAVQTAVDNAVGAGRWVVAGVGGSRTFTADGALDNTDLDPIQVQTAKLTGGTSSVAPTTGGGAARTSYTIAQDGGDYPPSTSGVLGFPGLLAVRLADLTVDNFSWSREDSGLYRVRIDWRWSGLFDILTGFTFPDCTTATTLRTKRGGLALDAVDHSRDVRALEYSFSNGLQVIHADVSPEPQAYIRTFPLGNSWTLEVEEDSSLSTSVRALVLANGQEGTKGVDMDARMGSLGDGGVFSSPESYVHLDGSIVGFGGTPPRARVPAAIDSLNSDSGAGKPVSLALVTDYDGGYLDPA